MKEVVYNRRLLEDVDHAGCLNCGTVYESELIEEWDGEEAVCPYCYRSEVVGILNGGGAVERLSVLWMSRKIRRG